jgi:uncharacterized protein (TIGR02594 family)
VADGVAGKLTLAALFKVPMKTIVAGPDGWPWMTEGMRVYGYHEIENNAALRVWLASDGRTLGDPRRLPWCGDFVETCILRALPYEPVPTNPYFARNWDKFGKPSGPRVGAIMVFERGPTSGHVGFYVGETRTHFVILGGNQQNRVSRSQVAKKRLLASRWPATIEQSAASRIVIDGNGINITENEE